MFLTEFMAEAGAVVDVDATGDGSVAVDEAFVEAMAKSRALQIDTINGMIIINLSINSHIFSSPQYLKL